ncbi:MAG: hypothetical protein R2838_16600 [Caldilineaceae bacterium]
MALQVAKIQGAGPIIVTGTDIDEHRLEVAAQLGDHVVNVQREDRWTSCAAWATASAWT